MNEKRTVVFATSALAPFVPLLLAHLGTGIVYLLIYLRTWLEQSYTPTNQLTFLCLICVPCVLCAYDFCIIIIIFCPHLNLCPHFTNVAYHNVQLCHVMPTVIL